MYAAFVDLTKAFDTDSRHGLWKILAYPGCPQKFLTILRQFHEGQQGQVKHNWSLSGSFPISNGVKQGWVLAPTLFSIYFSIMLHGAKEDLADGIYIRFRADGDLSIFDVSSHARKPSRNSSLSCFLLTTVALSPTRRQQYRTSSTAFLMQPRTSLTIRLKKTEVLYQHPPREAYSPPHISIDGTNLNAVEHFIYLNINISNGATGSKDLDNCLSKANNSLDDRQREYGRVTRSACPQSSKYAEPSSIPPSFTVQIPGFSIGSRSGKLSGFTNAVRAPFLSSNGKTTCQTKKILKKANLPSIESFLLQV